MVELSVQDSGPGLTIEDVDRIFERFYRADASRQRDDGGSGLGLAIARSIVQAHGGQVSADNTELKNRTYAMVRQLDAKFKEIHKTTNCRQLIKYDIQTADGFMKAKEAGVFETVCSKCISDAVQIVEALVSGDKPSMKVK